MRDSPPRDWNDKDAWDRYFDAALSAGHASSYPDGIVRRFLNLAHEKGGRIWFPGCGLDPYPITYAERGCNVLATDFSPAAIKYQRQLAAAFVRATASGKVRGTLDVMEHDFTHSAPGGTFDLVINCRAFQGLSASGMAGAAIHFHAALRPGGACIIDTMNVQGDRRNVIENSLLAAGFYIPFEKSGRWYREQLNATGITYWMVLGRPHVPRLNQYPPERFSECAERDQKILDSFHAEYERRCQDEAADVNAKTNDPATVAAHVVY